MAKGLTKQIAQEAKARRRAGATLAVEMAHRYAVTRELLCEHGMTDGQIAVVLSEALGIHPRTARRYAQAARRQMAAEMADVLDLNGIAQERALCLERLARLQREAKHAGEWKVAMTGALTLFNVADRAYRAKRAESGEVAPTHEQLLEAAVRAVVSEWASLTPDQQAQVRRVATMRAVP